MIIAFKSPVQGGTLTRALGASTVGPVTVKLNFNDLVPDPIEKCVDAGPVSETRFSPLMATEPITVVGRLYKKGDPYSADMPLPTDNFSVGVLPDRNSPLDFDIYDLKIPPEVLGQPRPTECQIIAWVKWRPSTDSNMFRTEAASLLVKIKDATPPGPMGSGA